MSNYIIFSIFIITAFLIISFPIILDIINMKKTNEIIEGKSLTRRSITLGLIYIYLSIQIYIIIFEKQANISEEFKTIVISVVAYYFGRSTALDNPNNKNNTKDPNEQMIQMIRMTQIIQMIQIQKFSYIIKGLNN